MTTIERFQKLQIELVRAGFKTILMANPEDDDAQISLTISLLRQSAADVETLDALAAGHGFSYVIGEDSNAAITLVGAH